MIENTTAITINSRTTTENWMQLIDPTRLISSLTIPGTHDTMTYDLKNGWIGVGFAECQDISLSEQLEKGIRFIDIRLRYDENEDGQLRACHGKFDCYIFFPQIVQICKDFLTKNPTECILMSIKNESGDWGDHFSQTIYNTVTEDALHWYYGHEIPKLADAKGKIVLLRRYKEENPSFQSIADIGLNLTNWPDDSSFIRPDSGNPCTVKYSVQDVYKTNVVRTYKFNHDVKPMLDKAIEDTDMGRLYLNFTSCTGPATPFEMASYTLEYLMDYLNDANVKFGRYGIIPMDFPQKDYNGEIINKLISMNFVDNLSSHDDYVIHSKINSHYVLDVKWLGHDNGTPVILNQFNRGDNQIWKLEVNANNNAFI
jgi:1-phosphatidylinositol phosphodiesterase